MADAKSVNGNAWQEVRVPLGPDAEVTGKLSFTVPTRIEGKLKGAGRAARALAQVVQLRPAHRPAGDHLDAVDPWRMDGERSLDPDPVRRLPHREHLATAAAAAADDRTLEHLDALLVAFDHADVDAHGVARLERRDVLAELLRLDPVDRIHGTHPLSGRGVAGQG